MRDLRVTIQVDGGPFPEIQRRVLRVEREGITVQRFDPPGELTFTWSGLAHAEPPLRHPMRLTPESLKAARRELLPVLLSEEPASEAEHEPGRQSDNREPLPPYDPAARYAEGDRFLHPRFGRGRVLKLVERRMEVRFRRGRKHDDRVLYCAGDRRAG
jgi:hypothetical protein